MIIPDRLSDIVAKGEVTERYYNPGELFDEVHILLTNDDRVNPAAVQPMVGRARLKVHNLPGGLRLFARSLLWRPALLRSWAEAAIALARQIRPDLIRCHGAHLNAYLASRIKAALGVPYVVSMHTNPDQSLQIAGGWKEQILAHAIDAAARAGLRDADRVLPVYEAIGPYLRRMGRSDYQVAYNVINPSHLRRKESYGLHDPVRVISVGRLIPGKNPQHLIRAVAELPRVHLTMVGNGPLLEPMRAVATAVGAADRITFTPSLPNDLLCQSLPEYDLFAVHCDYWGVSKAALEALLTGLPVIHNISETHVTPELNPEYVALVPDSTEGYRSALVRLTEDNATREALGRAAFAHAQQHWAPERTEAVFAAIYREVMA